MRKNISLNEVESLEEQTTSFQEKTVYYDRNAMTLDDVKEQVKNKVLKSTGQVQPLNQMKQMELA